MIILEYVVVLSLLVSVLVEDYCEEEKRRGENQKPPSQSNNSPRLSVHIFGN